MQQQDSPFGSVLMRGRLEEVDQGHQGPIKPEDGVGPVVDGVGEEAVAGAFLAHPVIAFAAEVGDHVINALEGVAGQARLLADQHEVVLE